MPSGVIRLLDRHHGYGFVSSSSGKDVFFHYSALEGVSFQSLHEGQPVIYKVGLGEKGLVAKEVRLCVDRRISR
ncbi:MAG: cold shock domain-containing protein [Dehalococcoidales bacterium]|nr:cold shock domain-containing protein [Dehalococcoidales bacterium]